MTGTPTTHNEHRLQIINILLGFLLTLGLLIRRLRRFGQIVKTTAISLLAWAS